MTTIKTQGFDNTLSDLAHEGKMIYERAIQAHATSGHTRAWYLRQINRRAKSMTALLAALASVEDELTSSVLGDTWTDGDTPTMTLHPISSVVRTPNPDAWK